MNEDMIDESDVSKQYIYFLHEFKRIKQLQGSDGKDENIF